MVFRRFVIADRHGTHESKSSAQDTQDGRLAGQELPAPYSTSAIPVMEEQNITDKIMTERHENNDRMQVE